MEDTPFKMTGRVKIEHHKEDGTVEVDEFDNLVVTAGKTFVGTRLANSPSAVTMALAVGTGGTAAAAGDVALETELYREACSVTPSTNTVQYQTTLAAGEATGTLTEAGIFNQATIGGTMLARTTFTAKVKASGDSMTLTWTLTIN